MAEGINRLDAVTVELIKAQEGYSAKAYKDAQGWSWGYGHYLGKDEMPYALENKISPEAAENLLMRDIEKHREPWVKDITRTLTSGQLAGLTSFAYNVGPNVMKRLVPLINEGKFEDVYTIMRKYRKARTGPNGELEIVPALISRREAEIEMIDSGTIQGRPGSPSAPKTVMEIWQEKKGLTKRVKEWFSGTKRTDTIASSDYEKSQGINEKVLADLRSLASRLNAELPVDVEETTWAARVMQEGRGWPVN